MTTITLYYCHGCPSWTHAWRDLGTVLAETGLDADVRLRDVMQLSDEERRGFGGSPTVHVLARLEYHLASVRARLEALRTLEHELAAHVERARAEPARPCDDGCAYLDPLPRGDRPQAAGASARASAPVTPVRNAR